MLYFIYYEVGLLQYSKIARSKIGTPTVDIFNSSILISQNCIRSERVAIISIVIFCLECFYVQRYIFYLSKSYNAISPCITENAGTTVKATPAPRLFWYFTSGTSSKPGKKSAFKMNLTYDFQGKVISIRIHFNTSFDLYVYN
jgi:hypothetical protein